MGLFDSLRHAFNPEVKETFQFLYHHYFKGLKSYCSGSKINVEGYTINTRIDMSNPSYDDMKRIHECKDSIIRLHNSILESEKIEADKAEIADLQKKKPHAFVYFCNKCLGGIIYNPNIIMPGYRKSARELRNIASSNDSNIIRISTIQVGTYYGNQYRPIPNNGGDLLKCGFNSKCYLNEPKSVSDLHILHVRKLLEYRNQFQGKEDEILAAIKEEDIRISFDNEINDNSRRKKYYKKFLSSMSKSESDLDYLVHNLSILDIFINQYIQSSFDELSMQYPLGVKEFMQQKQFGESDIDLKERALNNKDKVQTLNTVFLRYNQLKRKYPKGLPAFEEYNSFDDGKNSASLTKEEIIECEEQIAKFEQFAEAHLKYSNWIKEQIEFASISRQLCPEKFGCYPYDINFPIIGPDGSTIERKYKVWQTFYSSFYTLLPGTSILKDYQYLTENAEENSRFLKGNLNYTEKVYDEIFNLICAYKERVGDISVVLGSNGLDDSESFAFNHTKLEYLTNKILDAEIPLYEGEGDIIQDIELSQHILIIELISTNNRLRKMVEEIRDKYKHIFPLISYISFRKGYDSFEVEEIINREERKKEEQKKKEEEEKRRLQEEKERKQREEDARRKEQIRLKEQTEQKKQLLLSKVASRNLLFGNLRYYSLLRYFPTTCDFEATESEWEDRWTVWNFKNTPGKTSSSDHQEALDSVIPRIKSVLFSSFGRDILKNLTLVCIPASSAIKTKARYEKFSNILCRETGMTNSFNHIQVVSSSSEKKFGGSGITSENLSFDNDFFKGKYILLFDDVITKGDSMLRFKRKMESLGAIVICGVSIGKTTHTR